MNPKFVRFSILLEDGFELKPGESLEGRIDIAFKDPYHTSYSNKADIRNTIMVNAKYQNVQGTLIPIHAEASVVKIFRPLKKSIAIDKSTLEQRTGVVGERIAFGVTV